jgi:AcrR family transcriptional regulator
MNPQPADERGATVPQTRKRARKPAQFPDRRSEILAASARLFAEFGFETTSVRQIADAVNILAGSLYHHFETKDEILHQIIRGPAAEIENDIERIAQSPVDAEHRLIALMIVRFHQYMRHWEVHAIIQNDTNFFRRREEFSYVQGLKSRNFQMLENLLEEGMQAKLFRPDIDTYLMIGMIIRILSSAANWYRLGDTYTANKPQVYTLEQVIDFHLDGIVRLVRLPSRLNAPVPMALCTSLALQKPAA